MPAREATVPLLDRAVQHGYGLFETVRVVRGRPFMLNEHLKRLSSGARVLEIDRPHEDLSAAAGALLAAWGPHDGVLKLLLTGGDPPALAPAFVLTVSPPRPLPEGARERGVSVEIATDVVAHVGPLARLKTTSYAERSLARRRAQARGHYEAILLDAAGNLVEGTATNVFFFKDYTLHTPSLDLGPLPGIARGLVLHLVRNIGIEYGFRVEEGAYPAAALESAEEAFLTNVLVGVLPIGRVGGRTRILAHVYDGLVPGLCK